MSKYLLNKFLYTVDRDPDLVERYRDDPAGTVAGGRPSSRMRCSTATTGEASTWHRFDRRGARRARRHDYPALFELGAHPFLTLTLFIAIFERDHAEPLVFQREYAAAARHLAAYPDIAT